LSGEPTTYVADVDSIVDGSLRKLVESGKVLGRVIIPKGAVDYFYSEAKAGRSVGFTGLQELDRLAKGVHSGVTIEVSAEVEGEGYERLKLSVRDYALRRGAVLVTSDPIQAQAAQFIGIKVLYTGTPREGKLRIEEYFNEKTMSVHLKEGAAPLAKVGRPGSWLFVKLSDKPLERPELEEMAREIIERALTTADGFVEIDRSGSTIVQLGDYRVVITRPPLSDGWEITAVRPIAKLKLEDYNLPEKLMDRLLSRAEGILIAGSPGAGKTTFAQALAEFYASRGKVVKTIESPRDMRLSPSITQYSKNYADMTELHDILLLSRPDYTVFDEMRDDEDFKLYVDLRLAGIGMIGVVHATTPIDAVQRLATRVELGMIPSIIDTVIFIDSGQVSKVYELGITVKLPTGLKEEELARPVVEVRDFLMGELEYEMYTFGEQVMVIPVGQRRSSLSIEDKVSRIVPGAEAEVRDGALIVKLPRRANLSSRKVRSLKKLAKEENLDLRFVPRED
jgi:ATPase